MKRLPTLKGSPYNDGTSGENKNDDAVQPGSTHTYVWQVPERSGSGPNDPSSMVWPYHSHVNETSDENAGLIGPMIIITREGMANPDGSPEDVDREFVTLFTVFDENKSPFMEQNMETFAGNASSANEMDSMPMDNDMSMNMDTGNNMSSMDDNMSMNSNMEHSNMTDSMNMDSNMKHSINGFILGPCPAWTW
jgi:hypothetical protein